MAIPTKENNDNLSGLRYVRLVFFKRDSDEHPLEDWLLLVHPTSTFGDIQDGLMPQYQDRFAVLRTTFGPVPYWTKPEPDTYIGEFCQTLYAVSKEEEYVLALVRTSISDYPLVLNYYSLKNGSTLQDVITLAAPELNSARITGYSAAFTDNAIGCIEEQKEKSHFPTVFIITTDDRPDEFEFTSESACSLGTLYLDCNELMRRSSGLKHCPLQMIHVSRALIHAVVSLSKLLDAPSDSLNVDAKNLEEVFLPGFRDERPGVEVSNEPRWYYPYEAVVFAVCENLERSHEELTEILKELDNDNIIPVQTDIESGDCHPAEPRIEKVFLDLCAEHPGAVAIRESYAQFKKLKKWDGEQEEEMRRLAPGPFFRLLGRLLNYLWRIPPETPRREIPSWRDTSLWGQSPSLPPRWSSDLDSQDLEEETRMSQPKLWNEDTHTDSTKTDLAMPSGE